MMTNRLQRTFDNLVENEIFAYFNHTGKSLTRQEAIVLIKQMVSKDDKVMLEVREYINAQ